MMPPLLLVCRHVPVPAPGGSCQRAPLRIMIGTARRPTHKTQEKSKTETNEWIKRKDAINKQCNSQPTVHHASHHATGTWLTAVHALQPRQATNSQRLSVDLGISLVLGLRISASVLPVRRHGSVAANFLPSDASWTINDNRNSRHAARPLHQEPRHNDETGRGHSETSGSRARGGGGLGSLALSG